jgi:hypothetical protein
MILPGNEALQLVRWDELDDWSVRQNLRPAYDHQPHLTSWLRSPVNRGPGAMGAA